MSSAIESLKSFFSFGCCSCLLCFVQRLPSQLGYDSSASDLDGSLHSSYVRMASVGGGSWQNSGASSMHSVYEYVVFSYSKISSSSFALIHLHLLNILFLVFRLSVLHLDPPPHPYAHLSSEDDSPPPSPLKGIWVLGFHFSTKDDPHLMASFIK